MSVIVFFVCLFCFFWLCLINSPVLLSPDSERVLPWLVYSFPEMSDFCRRGKRTENATFPVGSLRLRPHLLQDSWSLQMRVKTNVKLFMMDDVADDHTEERTESADRRDDTDGFSRGTVEAALV